MVETRSTRKRHPKKDESPDSQTDASDREEGRRSHDEEDMDDEAGNQGIGNQGTGNQGTGNQGEEDIDNEIANQGQETGNQDQGRWNWKPFVVIIIAVAVACVAIPYKDAIQLHFDAGFQFFRDSTGNMRDSSTQTDPDLWDVFKNGFEGRFIPKYNKAVPAESFKVIKSSIKNTFRAIESKRRNEAEGLPEDTVPSVFLILGREGNANVSCFVDDLEQLIAESLSEKKAMKLKGPELESSDSLDRHIKDALGEREECCRHRHVITIDNINELRGDSFLHLHPYTDHTSARYREAIIILVGYTEDINRLNVRSSMKEMDSLASSFLQKTFISHLKMEQIEPMIARIADSVTAVLDYPGTKSVCTAN